jgi:hypothetical protein
MHKLIGQGTHGKIYRKNNSIVIKEFENRPMPQDCLCSRFKNNCKSLCDHIHYEFIIQEFLYNAINQELHQLKIKIPKAYNFALSTNNTMCHYEMDYIHSCKSSNSSNLIQINMDSPDMDDIVPDVGLFFGYNKLDLTNCNISSIQELVYQIGLLFSYLHYVLHIDGYDCELVMGRLDGENKCDIFLIDFDKVSCFEFKLGYISRRKIDESIIEEKEFNTVKKIAWFLFSGIIGMSLLPRDPSLKNIFIDGYSRYINFVNREKLVIDVYNNILGFIENYGRE